MSIPTLTPRATFVEAVSSAIRDGRPFAAGKLGTSEKTWLYYPIVRASPRAPRQRLAFEASLKFHALKQSGVFPPDPEFLLAFTHFYVEQVRALDSIGLFLDRPGLEAAVLNFHGLTGPFVHFADQEPDRSVPDNPDACYLPALRDRRILIVCPFARFLQTRATADTFEAVWARTGKRWFYPAAVDALEFPYGFHPETWRQYPTAIDLYETIVRDMERRDFDVALIGAAGLGIPLAAAARRLGKVGLSLGGHLQVLFGVAGRRWTEQRQDFVDAYINAAWTEVPARYRTAIDDACDRGAYW